MAAKIVVIAILALGATGKPFSDHAPSPPSYISAAPAPSGPAQYNFNYAVKEDQTGNDFSHQEARNGDDTEGTFSAKLPGGRLYKVNYDVNGDSGFLADVSVTYR